MIYAANFGSLMDGEKEGINIIVAHTQTRYPEWQERGDTAAPPVATSFINTCMMLLKKETVEYRLT